jgi:hypothetical protein
MREPKLRGKEHYRKNELKTGVKQKLYIFCFHEVFCYEGKNGGNNTQTLMIVANILTKWSRKNSDGTSQFESWEDEGGWEWGGVIAPSKNRYQGTKGHE